MLVTARPLWRPYVGRGVLDVGLAGQPEQAVAQLRLAAQLDPSDAGTLSNLGVTLDAMGRVEEARDALSRALQVDPNHVDARFNLARLMLVRENRAADAAAELERVVAAEPRNAGALVGVGHTDVIDRLSALMGLSELPFPLTELFWGFRRLLVLDLGPMPGVGIRAATSSVNLSSVCPASSSRA